MSDTTGDLASLSLDELAQRINTAHADSQAALQSGVQHALNAIGLVVLDLQRRVTDNPAVWHDRTARADLHTLLDVLQDGLAVLQLSAQHADADDEQP